MIRRALEVKGVRRAASLATASDGAGLDAIIGRMRDIVTSGQRLGYLDEDEALHASLARSPQRHVAAVEIITVAKVDLDRMRQLSATVPGHLDRVTDQHAAIVDAVKRGKADQAELAMRIHLESSFELMSGLLRASEYIFVTGEQ